MTRGRVCFVCAFRLAIYGAAMYAVGHVAGPPTVARLAVSIQTSAYDLTEPLVAVLALGMLLEVLSGAVRWR
jgi:hypothetical protein